jgi:predicted DNA-binding protein (UPF0251 family)
MTTKKAKKTPGKPPKIGRPRKPRYVRNEPKTRQFSPRGRPGRPGYRELKFEELEAIRLSDFMGLNQRDAAAFMKVSQQTFSRVLRHGRKSLAEALIKGEIIKVRGGDFKIEKMA